MLVTSIFSFSHGVSYSIQDINHHFSNIQFVVCKYFRFGHVQNSVVWDGVNLVSVKHKTCMCKQPGTMSLAGCLSVCFSICLPVSISLSLSLYHWLFSFYLSLLPVAHLSDAPRRRLVVTGDSARIQDETIESSAWFFNVLGV